MGRLRFLLILTGLGAGTVIAGCIAIALLNGHDTAVRSLWICLGLASFWGGTLASYLAARHAEDKTPSPLLLALIWVGGALLAWMPGSHQLLVPWLFACVGWFTLALMKLKPGLFFLITQFGAVSSACLLHNEPALAQLAIIMVLLIGAAWLFKSMEHEYNKVNAELRQTRRSVGQLAEANVRLQNHAIQAREWLINQERYRIAREIHDSLGHTLTGLVVKLQATEALIQLDPVRTAEEIRSACAMTREALQETRAAVSSLRDPVSGVLHGSALWVKLCETYAACTGVKIKIDIEQGLAVDDTINAVFYRFIQEALTNAYRHGEASMIDVAVWGHPDALLGRVSDNGQGILNMREGFGLTGIRERIGELGGEVAWRSEYGKGFDLAIKVPWPGGGDAQHG